MRFIKAGLVGSMFIVSAFSIHHRFQGQDTYIDIDFSKPSTDKRMCVIDHGESVYCTWVTHGAGSGGLYAERFSNEFGSHMSSLGTYRIAEKYHGAHGLSYRLDGLSEGLNDNVRARSIVIHDAPYIGYGETGRSFGCLAIPEADKSTLFSYIHSGMLINVHK